MRPTKAGTTCGRVTILILGTRVLCLCSSWHPSTIIDSFHQRACRNKRRRPKGAERPKNEETKIRVSTFHGSPRVSSSIEARF
ncbi:hypothetical protein BCR43DRAFT_296672 [Syncephalastrum racemosum]|uniref:Secreted protein n=1 Tax=Syncephalastrum racemosum TaxID=13706 RepID=A0A1X2H9B1_SYNRA|nr:hypothetical protein BCR43DRAFT_296672 [Syncephalastrum racemosum]